MMSNLVSIIMPSWNSELTIADSINSIIRQTYTNWELIITDDCSSDGTIRLLKEFANKEPRIKLFFNDKNSGAGISRNNCIKNAKGRFIAFLDSDDMWHPEKLSRQVAFMLNNNYALTY
ncbi:glycosyltransferase family 2 protein, partial [Cronobacter sakazakii]|nr:glycosyltransferase family 2 protein [Cronobacter sakazakii]